MASTVADFHVGEAPHQMYVQYWPPAARAAARPCALVLIHGGSHTGVVWTTLPSGEPGWAPYFASQGWPVYVVDWPGVGRSGFAPDFVTMGAAPIVDGVVALLDRIGPAALVGHSIGGAVACTAADRAPHRVPALIGLAASPPANVAPPRPPLPLDGPQFPDRERARATFANTARFPHAHFEAYFRALVPLSPSVGNAVRGIGRDLWIERPAVLRDRPILYLAAEEDAVVTRDRSEAAAAFLGVPHTLLGADWGLPGHGHLLIVEEGNGAIAARLATWLEQAVPALGR